jgi:hypothetical protein
MAERMRDPSGQNGQGRPRWQPGSMNYVDTFITAAPDCPVSAGVVPPVRGGRVPAHAIQYELLAANPYGLTQEDVLWEVHVRHKGLHGEETSEEARAAFFATPRACLRSSALPKKYGWGIHFDPEGKAALYPMESEEYRRFARGEEPGPVVVAALRSCRV